VVDNGVSNIARVDVMEQLEGEQRWQAKHLDCDRHEVPVPHLELLMTARNQLNSTDVAD
jgi:hypothetical protein